MERFPDNRLTTSSGSGVLTSQEIQHFGVIQGFSDSSCQLTSYDLRLGSCHYVYDNSQGKDCSGWSLFHIGSEQELHELNNREASTQKYETPKPLRHTLTIPAYGSAIIELKEIVDTYTAAVEHNTLIVGRFDLKLSQVYQALISQQATQVEPLYKGKLYCFIHNLSDRPILLKEDEKIATIEFSYAGMCLSEEQRKGLIDERKETAEKYASSMYASKENLGIGEVRWFYEQDRLPPDCGLNRLHTEVSQKVTQATEQFDQQFENYFEKEKTLHKISERVNDQIQKQRKNWELLVTVITVVMSLGIGSIIWMFYQDLIKVMERQEMYNIYLSGKDCAKELSQIEASPTLFPWLLLYALLLIAIIAIAILAYLHYNSKEKKTDTKVIDTLTEELSDLKKENKALREDLSNLEHCYDALVNSIYKKKS